MYFKLPVLFLTMRQHTDYGIWRKVDILVTYQEKNAGQLTQPVQPWFQLLRMLVVEIQ